MSTIELELDLDAEADLRDPGGAADAVADSVPRAAGACLDERGDVRVLGSAHRGKERQRAGGALHVTNDGGGKSQQLRSVPGYGRIEVVRAGEEQVGRKAAAVVVVLRGKDEIVHGPVHA